MLKEAPPRQGYFEVHQLDAVCRLLPVDLRPIARFAYITGWRVPSEVLTLTWAQVSFEGNGSVRLEPGTTKNDQAPTFPLTDELRALLEEQRARTDEIQRRTGQIVPYAFHRRGQPIKDFRRAWHTACEGAGFPGRIPHDFRPPRCGTWFGPASRSAWRLR
jgi:integrase